jgi:hypothetical protein
VCFIFRCYIHWTCVDTNDFTTKFKTNRMTSVSSSSTSHIYVAVFIIHMACIVYLNWFHMREHFLRMISFLNEGRLFCSLVCVRQFFTYWFWLIRMLLRRMWYAHICCIFVGARELVTDFIYTFLSLKIITNNEPLSKMEILDSCVWLRRVTYIIIVNSLFYLSAWYCELTQNTSNDQPYAWDLWLFAVRVLLHVTPAATQDHRLYGLIQWTGVTEKWLP